MMKHALLAGAMILAVPVLAQTAPRTPSPTAEPQATEPMAQTAPANTAVQPAPDAQATPQTADPGTPDQTARQSQAAEPGAAQPAATGNQVASVVDDQFATYDKNGDGKLSKAEFGAWMTSLKQATDPKAKADPAYNSAAFAQADKDKNQSVSKAEVERFLKAGQS